LRFVNQATFIASAKQSRPVSLPASGVRFAAGQLLASALQWRCGRFVLLLLVTLVLQAFLPLRKVVQVGGDEGYSLMKAALQAQGYPLYSEIWSDQPPLYTTFLQLLFRCCGTSALPARIASLVLASLLLWSTFEIINQKAGAIAASLASFLLASSDSFLTWSCSAMPEMPTLALAAASAFLAARVEGGGNGLGLAASGALLGMAVQVKLSATLFIGPILIDLARHRKGNAPGLFRPWPCRSFVLWGIAFGAALLGIGILFPGEMNSNVLLFHLSQTLRVELGGLSVWARLADVSQDRTALIGGALGLALILKRRQWQHLWMLVLLGSAVGARFVCVRPWAWYHLHFAIPLACLAAIGLSWLFKAALNRTEWKSRLGGLSVACAAATLVSCCLVEGASHISNALAQLRDARPISDSALIRKMRSHGDTTRWAYSDQVIYPFHAGLLVPPWLAVVSQKRIASKAINEAVIIATLQAYTPEQVLVSSGTASSPVWKHFLKVKYQFIMEEAGLCLFWRKSPGAGHAEFGLMFNAMPDCSLGTE
jgi:hypothetical protein